MDQKITREQLERFYKGDCSPEEHRQILEWLKSSGDEHQVNNFLKEHWEQVKPQDTLPEPDYDRIFEKVASDTWGKENTRKIGIYTQIMRIAAIFAGFILLATAAYYLWQRQQTIVYATGNGEQVKLTLPDQSSLVLNANSTVKYKKEWATADAREIWLDGEAFFSVTHTATNQVFLVHTSKGCTIEVLGTTFNVYNRKSATRIVLNSGKIKLNLQSEDTDTSTQLVMLPGEMVEFTDNPVQFNKQVVNTDLYSSWKTNKWILKNESLQRIAARIEETYGIKVIIKHTKTTGHVTGIIPTENLDILLQALATTLKVEIIRKNNQIIIQ